MGLLTFRSVELQGDGYCIDIVQGYWEPADVRGENRVTPGMVGQPDSIYVRDTRTILLEGYISGAGASVAARRESYSSRAATILATMAYDAPPGVLLALSPYLGLVSGDTATINARCVNAVSVLLNRQYTAAKWSFKLESTDPEWVIGS